MARVLLYFALSLSTAAYASAQELVIPARMMLDEALRLASERNPTLAAAGNEVEIAAAARIDARLRPNPAFTFDAGGYPMLSNPSGSNNSELTLRIDQEIELGGRRKLRIQSAEAGISAAEAGFLDHRRKLEFNVRSAYFGVVLAKADLEVAQTVLQEIDRVIGLNRARYEQGEISGGELRRIQVERLKFVEERFAAELALRNARSGLLALFNAPNLGAEFDVVETLNAREAGQPMPAAPPALDPAPLRVQALTLRPDLLAAQRDVAVADTQTQLQRALRSPNITAGGGYFRSSGSGGVAIGLTVPLPLSNRNQGGVARAEAARRQAASLASAAATEVLLDVQHAINAVDVANARVDYIERDYLTPARESRDIVLAAYRLGTADLIDFLDAQRSFRDTLRTFNRALYEQRLGLFQLTAATGGNSPVR